MPLIIAKPAASPIGRSSGSLNFGFRYSSLYSLSDLSASLSDMSITISPVAGERMEPV